MTDLHDAWDRNFLKVPKRLYGEVGVVAANVFARIAGYCDMSTGMCYVSQTRIGAELGISRSTVNRHIKTLCQIGYLEDQGPFPDDPGGPNRYKVITWEQHKELNEGVANCDRVEAI